MIIYDDRIEMEVEAFKDVLQVRNSVLDNDLSILTTLSFFFDNIFGVFLNGHRLAGKIAVEKISQNKYRVYCNKLKLTNLNGLIANILIANKERLNFVFNKKENEEEFLGHFCPLLPCF